MLLLLPESFWQYGIVSYMDMCHVGPFKMLLYANYHRIVVGGEIEKRVSVKFSQHNIHAMNMIAVVFEFEL